MHPEVEGSSRILCPKIHLFINRRRISIRELRQTCGTQAYKLLTVPPEIINFSSLVTRSYKRNVTFVDFLSVHKCFSFLVILCVFRVCVRVHVCEYEQRLVLHLHLDLYSALLFLFIHFM